MELNFRKLRADEIEVKAVICPGGVQLLLYKDARCDQNILDEAVKPMGWRRIHPGNNFGICEVSIYDSDRKEWVTKQDVGSKSNDKEKDKTMASDSFKRACFNWGIGRELYTASKLDLFISKEHLRNYEQLAGQNNKDGLRSGDFFVVLDIQYIDEARFSVTIGVLNEKKEIYYKKTFTRSSYIENLEDPKQKPAAEAQKTQSVHQKPEQSSQTTSTQKGPFLRDDEVILMGNCRNKKYGHVKKSKDWVSFLQWASTSNTKYAEPDKADQFARIKLLIAAGALKEVNANG